MNLKSGQWEEANLPSSYHKRNGAIPAVARLRMAKEEVPLPSMRRVRYLHVERVGFDGLFGGIHSGVDPSGRLFHGFSGLFRPGMHGLFCLRSHI